MHDRVAFAVDLLDFYLTAAVTAGTFAAAAIATAAFLGSH